MRNGDVQTDQFLADTPWSNWDRQPMAGDASSRRYIRLTQGGGTQTAILMIAPPDLCGPIAPFVSVAEYLNASGLCAPEILHADHALGLAVIEDLGATDVAHWLVGHPDEEGRLYDQAVDCLIHLLNTPPPPGLSQMTPEVGAEMLSPFFEELAPNLQNDARAEIEDCMHTALKDLAPFGASFSLRDYHAENLIWRPDRAGLARMGLLDFQDAFIAPAGYDLVSLLRDARRDVSPETAQRAASRFGAALGLSGEEISLIIATLSVQRNLRILGIFARLARVRGKRSYLDLQPRVWDHVARDLRHPALSDLHEALAPTLRKTA